MKVREIRKRPILSQDDAEVVRRTLRDAEAVSLQSGWPTPSTDITYRNRTVGNAWP